MKAYHGILDRVGDGAWKGGITKISVIKIGDKMLSNIEAQDRMYSFLDVGRQMTIYIHRFMFFTKIIIGVNHKDGDKICMRLSTLFIYILNISFMWLFIGIALWVGFAAIFGWASCTTVSNAGIVEQQAFDSCMNNAMLMAGIGSIGLYAACIIHLIKDYILVRSLTLIGK